MAGIHKTLTVTMATNATSSSGVNIKGWDGVAVQAPGTYVVYVQVSQDDSTYQRLCVNTGASAAVGPYTADFNALSGSGIAIVPCGGMNYMKLEVGSAITATKVCYIHVYQK